MAVDPDSLLDGEEAVCGFAEVSDGPEGLLFMVGRAKPADEWRINRIDVVDPSRIATGGGIRIGATEDDVKRVYGAGRIKVEPHHYTRPEGHYLTLDIDGRGGLLLLFETDGTEVLQYRAGREEAVRYVEGCA